MIFTTKFITGITQDAFFYLCGRFLFGFTFCLTVQLFMYIIFKSFHQNLKILAIALRRPKNPTYVSRNTATLF